MDIVESTLALAKGILLYAGSAAILIATDKMPITCKWAKNHFNDTNNKIGAILSDPEAVLDGIAQGVSDTVDNKGIFYAVGYILPSIFGDKGLDKVGELAEGLRGVEGVSVLSKISKTEEVLKAENVEGKVTTEGVNGIGKTKGFGKVEGVGGISGADRVSGIGGAKGIGKVEGMDGGKGASGAKKSILPKDLSNYEVPTVKNGDFNKWFNELSVEDFNRLGKTLD